MKLNELLRGLDGLEMGPGVGAEVASLAYDSRQVQRGSLFFAIQGEKADGHAFIPQALERGAVAVVSERLPPGESGGLAPRFAGRSPRLDAFSSANLIYAWS